MAIQKYIIDKSDLGALLRGEELAIQPRGNIRGFCVEIAGDLTNGDVIKALFPGELLTSITNALWWGDNMSFSKEWWNAPYKAESEEEDAHSD